MPDAPLGFVTTQEALEPMTAVSSNLSVDGTGLVSEIRPLNDPVGSITVFSYHCGARDSLNH